MRRLWAGKFILIAAALLLPTALRAGTTYYMDLNGLDSQTGTSVGDAVRTSTKAFTLMVPGDVLMIGTGTWSSGVNFSSPTYGNATDWCYYKASSDGATIFTQDTWMNQPTTADRYVQFEGIYSSGTFQKNIVGRYMKFKRMTFFGGESGSGGIGVAVGTDGQLTQNILFEDCIFFGPDGRYNLLIYRSNKVVVRRCVIRHDGEWAAGGNPEAGYTVYSSSQVESQNVMVVASTGPYTEWSQAIYNVNAHDTNALNNWRGIVALKNTKTGLIIDADATDHIIEHSILWDNQEGCISFGSTDSSVTVRNVTCGRGQIAIDAGAFGGFGNFDGDMSPSTFKDIIVTSWTTGSDFQGTPAPTFTNTFNNDGEVTGATIRTFNPFTNGLSYLPRIEDGSILKTTGSAGGQIGATLNEYGASGTLWGDSGYADVISTNVFSNATFIAMNARMQTEMRAYKPRDFATASYTETFCEWVYEYIGSTVPAGVCAAAAVDTSSPTAPGVPTVTSTGTTTLDLSWTASTDDVGVTSYEIDVSTDAFSTFSAGYNDFDMGSGTTEQLTGLTASTSYSFRVRAKDAAGNTSSSSSTGIGTTSAVEVTANTSRRSGGGSMSGGGTSR